MSKLEKRRYIPHYLSEVVNRTCHTINKRLLKVLSKLKIPKYKTCFSVGNYQLQNKSFNILKSEYPNSEEKEGRISGEPKVLKWLPIRICILKSFHGLNVKLKSKVSNLEINWAEVIKLVCL